jgi:hypothetical protein
MDGESITVIKQAYHRNGIGGAGFVVSLFDWGTNGLFVGISFGNERNKFIEQTAVLNIAELDYSNIEFAKGNSWRGSDYCGPTLWEAWEKERNQ